MFVALHSEGVGGDCLRWHRAGFSVGSGVGVSGGCSSAFWSVCSDHRLENSPEGDRSMQCF